MEKINSGNKIILFSAILLFLILLFQGAYSLADGEYCASDGQCNSGHCGYAFQSYANICCAEGEDCCLINADCGNLSKECGSNYYCVNITGKAIGEYCNGDSECTSGNCNNGICCAYGKECCTSDYICNYPYQKGLTCINYACEQNAKKSNGESCTYQVDCESGNCSNGICCDMPEICCTSNSDCPDSDWECGNNYYCEYLPGNDNDGYDYSKKSNCEFCATNDDCLGGTCAWFPGTSEYRCTDGTAGTCCIADNKWIYPYTSGTDCCANSDCSSGYECSNYKCMEKQCAGPQCGSIGHVTDIQCYAEDQTDYSIGEIGYYPDCSFDDTEGGYEKVDGIWQGSYTISDNELCLKASNITAPGNENGPPQNYLAVGFTVTLSDATFDDGSTTKNIIVYNYTGNPGGITEEKCVEIKKKEETQKKKLCEICSSDYECVSGMCAYHSYGESRCINESEGLCCPDGGWIVPFRRGQDCCPEYGSPYGCNSGYACNSEYECVLQSAPDNASKIFNKIRTPNALLGENIAGMGEDALEAYHSSYIKGSILGIGGYVKYADSWEEVARYEFEKGKIHLNNSRNLGYFKAMQEILNVVYAGVSAREALKKAPAQFQTLKGLKNFTDIKSNIGTIVDFTGNMADLYNAIYTADQTSHKLTGKSAGIPSGNSKIMMVIGAVTSGGWSLIGDISNELFSEDAVHSIDYEFDSGVLNQTASYHAQKIQEILDKPYPAKEDTKELFFNAKRFVSLKKVEAMINYRDDVAVWKEKPSLMTKIGGFIGFVDIGEALEEKKKDLQGNTAKYDKMLESIKKFEIEAGVN